MTKGRFATTVGVMVLVTALTAAPGARQQNRADVALRAAMERETVRGDVSGAIADYRAIVTAYRTIDRVVVAQALVRLAEAYQKLDDGQARTTYEQIVRDFSDQPASVSVARTKLAALAALRGTSASPLALVCTGCVDDVASVSNDGRWMAWTDWETGDLVVRDMTSGSVRRLLVKAGSFKDSDAYAQDPVFSRDATRIAYTWETGKPDAAVELRVVSVQPGSSSEVFFRGGEFDWATARAWSPDGMRVLAELRKPDQTLQLAWVSTADGRAQTLKSLDWRAVSTHATLSPDGRFIAYQALVTSVSADPSAART